MKQHSASPQNTFTEPESAINQTDSRTQYKLMPEDLTSLQYFPKPNPVYGWGNTAKLFNKADVQRLAYRKAAVVAVVEEDDDVEAFLDKGKRILEGTLKGDDG